MATFIESSDRPAQGIALMLTGMAKAIAYRGPDSRGHWADAERGVAFGHLRLAIVDLTEAGAQPMIAPSGRFVIVFNGEIYNYADLRANWRPQEWPRTGAVILIQRHFWQVLTRGDLMRR